MSTYGFLVCACVHVCLTLCVFVWVGACMRACLSVSVVYVEGFIECGSARVMIFLEEALV